MHDLAPSICDEDAGSAESRERIGRDHNSGFGIIEFLAMGIQLQRKGNRLRTSLRIGQHEQKISALPQLCVANTAAVEGRNVEVWELVPLVKLGWCGIHDRSEPTG